MTSSNVLCPPPPSNGRRAVTGVNPPQQGSAIAYGTPYQLGNASIAQKSFDTGVKRRKLREAWHNRFNSRKTSRPSQLSDRERIFLNESTRGLPRIEEEPLRSRAFFYVEGLASEARDLPQPLCELVTGKSSSDDNADAFLNILRLLVQCLNTDKFCTVDKFVERAVEESYMTEACRVAGKTQDAARYLCLTALGRLTRFFEVPFPEKDDYGTIYLDAGQQNSQLPQVREKLKFCRPMFEIFDMFENLLPTRSEETLSRTLRGSHDDPGANPPSPDALHVSCLNAQILTTLIEVKICWTKCLTSHLDYDPVRNNLNVFALPSFLDLHRSENSILSSSLQEYYKGRNRPEGYTDGQLAQEIRNSYKLLFRHDARSRKVWMNQERKRAAVLNGIVDPCLAELCDTDDVDRPTVHKSFQISRNFPILGDRLRKLQDDVLNQHTDGFKALWMDRRDMLRWYTFWAVLLIGGLGVVMGIVQCVLSGVQVGYAMKSLKSQRHGH